MEDNDVKSPEAGGEQKQEVDYNKYREYERKAGKYEETKQQYADLTDKYNQLLGKVEMLSGGNNKNNQRTPDELTREALRLIESGSSDAGNINDYTVGMQSLIEGRLGSEKQEIINILENKLADMKFDNKWGRVIARDPDLKKRYDDTISHFGNVTPQQKETIANLILGNGSRGASEFERMGAYSSGSSVDGFDDGDEYSELRRDKSVSSAAKLAVKKGQVKDENEFYKNYNAVMSEMGR